MRVTLRAVVTCLVADGRGAEISKPNSAAASGVRTGSGFTAALPSGEMGTSTDTHLLP